MIRSPLTLAPASTRAMLPLHAARAERHLQLGDAASEVMSDFTRENPWTVGPDRPIDAALEDMIRSGIRALIVIRDEHIIGLVTSYDIQGERPMQFLASRGEGAYRHDDLQVKDVMTPFEVLPVLRWSELRRARVADLVELLAHEDLSHVLVVEAFSGGQLLLRGLVSRGRLERQLGQMPAPTVIAETGRVALRAP
jgi:CBS-domain-containing membrane protein